MTRLFHGLAGLAAFCAMTLVIGCSGSSTSKAKCDGSACGDAKGDTTRDVGNPTEVPAVKPDTPTVTPDAPAVTPDTPVVTPDTAAAPDAPAVTPDAPADTRDASPPTDAVEAEAQPDTNLVESSARPDTNLPRDTGPSDTRRDTSSPNPDAGPDAPAALNDGAGDGGEDAEPEDAPADAAADAGAGEVSDGGCAGALCDNFEGDNPDAGLPTALTLVTTNAGTWAITTDGANQVLEQSQFTSASFVSTGLATWTNQTIQVKVKLLGVGGGGSISVCGRFIATGIATPPPSISAYCLEISSGTGANTGSMVIKKLTSGASTTIGTAISLPIVIDNWHTYRLTISGTGPVTISAYLDDSTTANVAVLDSATVRTAGAVALGASNATAEFDDLLVTTP